ncbi:uncharacterized protein LOC121377610 isoform X2 [Gigantopelta aegis]|nr:uncharacterized protein LOC121377610 isoform X2 [Gigantopelta aegis]
MIKQKVQKGPTLDDTHGRMTKEMSQEEVKEFNTKIIYLRGEFEAMDLLQDNKLNMGEFMRLMRLLQYPGGSQGAKQVWLDLGLSERNFMNEDEYVNLMLKDEQLERATSIWRDIYEKFDWDKSGWASTSDVETGLKELLGGDISAELKKNIAKMDENKDGKIYYSNFLRMQLGMVKG